MKNKKKNNGADFPKKNFNINYKILSFIFIILFAINSIVLCFSVFFPKKYTINSTVTQIIPNSQENTVIFSTTNGHSFAIITKNPYFVGENYILIMSDKATTTVEDDIILEIKRPVE